MKKVLYNLFIFLSIMVVASCENREAQPIDLNEGVRYFPLDLGSYVVYEVNEITYSVIDTNKIKTRKYYLKEVISDTLPDASNNLSYLITRYSSDSLDKNWRLDSVWHARRSGNQIIKSESNVPYVKLIWPLREGAEWNGNAYNSKGEETYKMFKVNRKDTVMGNPFDSTVTVLQRDDSSSISQDYREEVYAKGVGVIYKKSIITFNLQADGTIKFPIEIARGTDYTQTIIRHGKE